MMQPYQYQSIIYYLPSIKYPWHQHFRVSHGRCWTLAEKADPFPERFNSVKAARLETIGVKRFHFDGRTRFRFARQAIHERMHLLVYFRAAVRRVDRSAKRVKEYDTTVHK